MENHPNQLPVPPAAAKDLAAIELLRVWAAGGRQHVVLPPDTWDDPASWGIMLVDLAKHVANAYEDSKGLSREAVLARLKAGFDAEWRTATDRPTGGIADI